MIISRTPLRISFAGGGTDLPDFVGFLGKPGCKVALPGWPDSWLYVLSSPLIEELPAGDPLDFGRDMLPAAVRRGERIPHGLGKAVMDVGTLEALKVGRTSATG